jgi:LSU ribosomal protein L15P
LEGDRLQAAAVRQQEAKTVQNPVRDTSIARGLKGGQMPLQRRVPKFGFTNVNRVEYSVINLGDLQKFFDAGKIKESKIDKGLLLKLRILKKPALPLKILGNGEVTTQFEITADAFTKQR